LRCLDRDRRARYADANAIKAAIADALATATPTPARRAARAPLRPSSVYVVSAQTCGAPGCTVGHRVGPFEDTTLCGNWLCGDHFDSQYSSRPGSRQHPHIGIETFLYLLDGRIVHRDSLGNVQTAKANGVSWLSCGRGVVHSERRDPVDVLSGVR